MKRKFCRADAAGVLLHFSETAEIFT